MHRDGVPHRAIHPCNIYIDSDDQGVSSLKLADFGMRNLINRETLAFYSRLYTAVRNKRDSRHLETPDQQSRSALLWFAPSDRARQRDASEKLSVAVLESLKKEMFEEADFYLPEEFFQCSLFDQHDNADLDEAEQPEMQTRRLTTDVVDEKADVYSLG